ncbi:MAG: hypothetical protein KY462_13305 [Actinobacteria bacterium]|nr:hypothetical protein [Actinomycetota bacterium]
MAMAGVAVACVGALSIPAAGTEAAERVGDPTAGSASLSADAATVVFTTAAGVHAVDRPGGSVERVDVSDSGAPANGEPTRDAAGPVSSADGGIVAFSSHASNLVAGDTNGVADAFVRDRRAGLTVRVSVGRGGIEPRCALGVTCNGSVVGDISADGRFVAFTSDLGDLVDGDANGLDDVFVHDRQTGATELISVSAHGIAGDLDSRAPAISADGRFVAFSSNATNLVAGAPTCVGRNLYVRDRATATTTTAIPGRCADVRGGVAMSADGRRVAFASPASDLVDGDHNGAVDVFVRDVAAGRTVLVSRAADATPGDGDSGHGEPALSPDGRYVAFASRATNLVDGDRNGALDVFVHDLDGSRTVRTSLAPGGRERSGGASVYAGALSHAGRVIAFGLAGTDAADDATFGPGVIVRAVRWDTGANGPAAGAAGTVAGHQAGEQVRSHTPPALRGPAPPVPPIRRPGDAVAGGPPAAKGSSARAPAPQDTTFGDLPLPPPVTVTESEAALEQVALEGDDPERWWVPYLAGSVLVLTAGALLPLVRPARVSRGGRPPKRPGRR